LETVLKLTNVVV